MDFCLTSLSILIGVGTWVATNSIFVTTWVTFLIHGLFVLIPQSFPALEKSKLNGGHSYSDDPFERAHVTAERALTRIIEKS